MNTFVLTKSSPLPAKIHIDKVADFAGFAMTNAKRGEYVKLLMREALTSDHPEFYNYSEQISNMFLSKVDISIESVYQYLVVIHGDLSSDLYVNEFQVEVEFSSKREFKKGERVTLNDIVDVLSVKFPEITITELDRVIFCFKVGWRFGLFFDLIPRVRTSNIPDHIKIEKLDIENMMISIGDLYRSLTFHHVYKTLESQAQYEEMKKDGWFPFIEIHAVEYKELSKIYRKKFNFESKINGILNKFNEDRIKLITEKWWENSIFLKKKIILEAGIVAYLDNNENGFINCIKTLGTEIEGILRITYLADTGKGKSVNSNQLISHIVDKAKNKTSSNLSLLFPIQFFKYLEDVIFPRFNIEEGKIDLSRHTASHGVADVQEYTKSRALQLILIIDQIYYYS